MLIQADRLQPHSLLLHLMQEKCHAANLLNFHTSNASKVNLLHELI